METNENYFEGIPLNPDRVFFMKFCEVEKVEPEYSERFFSKLIKQLEDKLKEKKEDRKKQGVSKESKNFADMDSITTYRKVFPLPSNNERELQRVLSICEKIKTNIWVYGSKEEQIEIECKERKSRLTKESIEIFYSIIDTYINEGIAVERIIKRIFDENPKTKVGNFDSIESLKSSFAKFIKKHQENEDHKIKIGEYLAEKEKRKRKR